MTDWFCIFIHIEYNKLQIVRISFRTLQLTISHFRTFAFRILYVYGLTNMELQFQVLRFYSKTPDT